MKKLGMSDVREVVPIVFVTIALVAVTWAGVFTFADQVKDSKIERSYASSEQNAKVFAEQVRNTIKSIESIISFTAYKILEDPSPDTVRILSQSGALKFAPLLQLAHIDAEGFTVSTQAGPDPNRTDLRDREHIRVHLDNLSEGLFIGRPVLGRVSGRWTIQLSRKILAPDGTMRGILVASLDPFYFKNFWRDVTLSDNALVALMHNDGFVRTRSHRLQWALETGLSRADFIAVIGNSTGGRIRDLSPDGFDRIGFYVRVPDLPLVVFSGDAVVDIERAYADHQHAYYLVGATITVLIVTFGFWFASLARRSRREERRAKMARQRLLDAVATMPEGFALFDASDRLVLANEALSRLYPRLADTIRQGVRFEELMRTGLARGQWVIPPGTQEGDWLANAIEGHRAPGETLEVRTTEGKWIRIMERKTLEGGRVGIRSDVTELKEREASLIASQEQLESQAVELRKLAHAARKADNAKSAFLTAMSHEIRTPLNAVLGFASLLRKTSLSAEQETYLRTIVSSASHLRTIVNDILDFSQLQAGRLQIEREAFDLASLLEEVEAITRVLVADKPVAVKFSLSPDLPRQIMGDGSRLYQVLLNLCSNAAKFTSSGEISVQALRSAESDRIKFIVSDTGSGISEAAQARLFTPFEQGEVQGKLRAAGTGLGLVICKKLLDLMNGAIRMQSAPGRGSAFEIDLPLEAAPMTRARDERSAGEGHAGANGLDVLVVDDANTARLFLKILLEKLGHRVTEARDGVEAVNVAKSKKFDLIFMDLQMPRLDGVEATRSILSQRPHGGKPTVVALTAHIQKREQHDARDAGFAYWMTKPLDEEQLLQIVGRAMLRA